METEVQRRRDGLVAAQRCLRASRAAIHEDTRDALERAAWKYLQKAVGSDGATREMKVAPPLPTEGVGQTHRLGTVRRELR